MKTVSQRLRDVVVNTGRGRRRCGRTGGWTWDLEMVGFEEPTLGQRVIECPEDVNSPLCGSDASGVTRTH